jgi:LysM repeat protein
MRHLFRLSLFLAAALVVFSVSAMAFAQQSGGDTQQPTPTPEGPVGSGVGATPLTPIGTTNATAVPSDQGGGVNSVYTVQRGDVLDSIAANYDVQTACLAQSNNLPNKGNQLKIGQTIVIDLSCPRYDGVNFVANPRGGNQNTSGQGGGGSDTTAPTPGPNDQAYTVQRGDVLDSIAQQFNVSLQSLMMANNIAPNKKYVLKIGTTLVIPGGAPPYGQFPATGAGANGDLGQGGGGVALGPGDQSYVMQPRDTLDGIGARLNKDVACIIQANSIKDTRHLQPGTTIIVPATCPNYSGFDTAAQNQGGTSTTGSGQTAAPQTTPEASGSG